MNAEGIISSGSNIFLTRKLKIYSRQDLFFFSWLMKFMKLMLNSKQD